MKSKPLSFWSLIATQFLGAFNDNLFKFAVSFLVTDWITDPQTQSEIIYGSGIIFALPFLMFSLVAGRLADRLSKSRIIILTKLFEVLVIGVALGGMFQRNIPIMLVALFLLAMQSSFFGPAKYGILPELVDLKNLPKANGYINTFTFVAILTGAMTAALLAGRVQATAIVMSVVTLLGLGTSTLISPLPAVNPKQLLSWNFMKDLKLNWDLIKDNIVLRRGLMTLPYFWFAGAVLQLNTIVYVEHILQASEKMVGLILFLIVGGVSTGSLLAGKLSRGKVELGFVPVGALGMSIFVTDLYFSGHTLARTCADMFMAGFSAGLFIIPLTTLLQARSPDLHRGRIIAFSNFLAFIAVFCGGLFPYILGRAFGFGPAEIFLALGLATLIVAIITWIKIPEGFHQDWKIFLKKGGGRKKEIEERRRQDGN